LPGTICTGTGIKAGIAPGTGAKLLDVSRVGGSVCEDGAAAAAAGGSIPGAPAFPGACPRDGPAACSIPRSPHATPHSKILFMARLFFGNSFEHSPTPNSGQIVGQARYGV